MVTATHDMTDVGYWQTLNRKSLLRFFLFNALHEKPMHGYEIATAVSVCCDGVRPTDAMIYPTLKDLEQNGYIVCLVKSDGARRRNVCALTEKGEEAFKAAAKAWAQALPQIETAVHAAGVTACCDVSENESAEISFAEEK